MHLLMIKNNKEIELEKKKDFFILKSIGEKNRSSISYYQNRGVVIILIRIIIIIIIIIIVVVVVVYLYGTRN